MLEHVLFALWFLFPAGLANATPIVAAVTPGLRNWNTPIDGGRKLRGKPLFGSHKTWRGIVSGVVMGEMLFLLQRLLYEQYDWAQTIAGSVNYAHVPLFLGALLGFGALAGDAIESLLKRQQGIESGKRWLPFDQLDYIIGAILVSLFFVRLPLIDYLWMLLLWFGMHLLFTYLGWLSGLKKDPI